jgi:hypothetical protein
VIPRIFMKSIDEMAYMHDHHFSSVPDACCVRLEEKEYRSGALPAPSLSR